VQPALLAAQSVELRCKGQHPIRAVNALARRQRFQCQAFSLVEPTGQQRTHRSRGRGTPDLERLPQLGCVAGVVVQGAVSRCDVSELQQVEQTPVVSGQRTRSRSCGLSQLHDSRRNGESLFQVVRT
jgi:hypothetical protein